MLAALEEHCAKDPEALIVVGSYQIGKEKVAAAAAAGAGSQASWRERTRFLSTASLSKEAL